MKMMITENPRVFAVLIDHYEDRLKDRSLPLSIKTDFKRALKAYKKRYAELNEFLINKSIAMSEVTFLKMGEILHLLSKIPTTQIDPDATVKIESNNYRVAIKDERGVTLAWIKRQPKVVSG